MSSAIEAERLVKRYGRFTAVSEVSLTVRAGETVGYLGPNGAGKTTTIRCMLGLLRPSAGSVRLLGVSMPGGRAAVLGRVGHIPGEFGLWPQLTGRQCLEYLGRLQGRPPVRRSELCDRFELGRAELGRRVRFYSRGMRQKIAIVQAFQHDPELVIMDEPTEGLDPIMKERFLDLLAGHRAAGGSALMSSHILSEVEEAADRVLVLRAGRVLKEIEGTDRAQRLRHCTVDFGSRLSAADLPELPGATDIRWEAGRVHFDHRGDMGPLLGVLAGLPVVEFVSAPGSLFDAFFELYE